jgi:nucleoside-diphosphate-sugar epimerase
MVDSDRLHVVLGAAGGAGAALVRELAAQGAMVRAVTRAGQPNTVAVQRDSVTWIAADARDVGQMVEACRGAAVIYHAVNVPYPAWQATLPPVMDVVIAAAADSGARLVYVDNLYMYGPVAGPLREDLPPAAVTTKGRLRAELAERLLQAHAEGTVQATIGRSSDYYGPGVTSSAAGEDLFRAILRGGSARWFGNLDQPHSLTFIDDAATALITLGADERSLGEVWHLPAAAPLTGRQLITLAGEIAGTRPRPRRFPSWAIRLAGLVNPMAREFAELAYQFEQPFVVDWSKYRQTFGGAPTPLREGLDKTLAWYRVRVG